MKTTGDISFALGADIQKRVVLVTIVAESGNLFKFILVLQAALEKKYLRLCVCSSLKRPEPRLVVHEDLSLSQRHQKVGKCS